MLALLMPVRAPTRQVLGDTPEALGAILEDGVNLAVWQRQLPTHIADFGRLLLSLGEPLAEAITLEMPEDDSSPNVQGLASGYRDLEGYEGFITDVAWLVSAYAYLLGATRIGLRLRALDKAMCPRFHVDHVPVRLITTYAGVGSEWLEEGVIDRLHLGETGAEPPASRDIQHIGCGSVALLKGERWHGNEGGGLVHRSPQLAVGERRLILTLDWLA